MMVNVEQKIDRSIYIKNGKKYLYARDTIYKLRGKYSGKQYAGRYCLPYLQNR